MRTELCEQLLKIDGGYVDISNYNIIGYVPYHGSNIVSYITHEIVACMYSIRLIQNLYSGNVIDVHNHVKERVIIKKISREQSCSKLIDIFLFDFFLARPKKN